MDNWMNEWMNESINQSINQLINQYALYISNTNTSDAFYQCIKWMNHPVADKVSFLRHYQQPSGCSNVALTSSWLTI